MKKIFLFIALLSGLISSAQLTHIPGYVERTVRDHVISTASDSSTHVPAGSFPRLGNGWARAGAIYVDTVGGGRGLWYYEGGSWKHVLDSANVVTSVLTNNGIGKSGDTLQLKDSLTRYTYLQASVHGINNTPFRGITIGNLPEAQSLNGLIGYNPLFNTYNPATLGLQRIYSTAAGDINLGQYGGLISTIFRISRDSVESIFTAGTTNELLPGLGGEFVGQWFPQRDSSVVSVGRDGQSGNVLFGQLDIGQSWGYNMNVVPQSGFPGFPISAGRTSIDFMRVIDNTRTHKIRGAGFSGFTTMYKTYQTTITGSTYEAGNVMDSVFGYRAYGDAYPLINRDTKAKALAVWDTKKAFAFYADPQYRYTNTVRDGYAFVAGGDSDLSHLPFLNIGPISTLPTRANNGNDSWSKRLYVNGDMAAAGNTYAYGYVAAMPVAVGTEAAVVFQQKDSSSLVSILGSYLSPSNRAARGGYWRSEIFSGAVMDESSTGGFLQMETGINHANITRQWRNGNFVIGHSVAMNAYRLYKKLMVNGASLFNDTVTIKNIPTGAAAGDTTNYKPLVIASNGDVFKGAWAGGSGASAGLNQIAIGTGSGITSSANFTYTGATLYGYTTNDVNFESESGSDLSGMQITPTKSLFYGPETSTNTVITILELRRQTSGTAASGIGSSYDYNTEDDGGTLVRSNSLQSRFTTVTSGATTSEFAILGRSAGTEQTIFTLAGTGAARLNNYGINTFAGTPTFILGVDASGNVVETSAGGAVTWNAITNPTGTQTLSFDDAELNAWTNNSNTETFTTIANPNLTTGTGILSTANALTTGSIFEATSTSTAKASGNGLFKATSSGANGSSSITNVAFLATVSNTGTTSVNTGFRSNVSGASTNWAFYADAGNYRSIGASGYYAQNSAGTAGISMVYDNGSIGTLSTTGGVRLDLDAASSTILMRRQTNIGLGIDFGNFPSFQVWKSASGTSNIQNWLTSGGTVLASVNQSGSFFIGGTTSATAYLHLGAGTTSAGTAPFKLTTAPVNTTPEAGALEYTTPQLFFTNGGAIRQELFQGQQSRVSTQFDKTNTTLANITGLTANVAAGKVYRFEAILYTTSDVGGGVKVAIGGTATATAIIYEGLSTDAGLTTQSRTTTLGNAVGAVTAVTAAYIKVTGTITVNAAGTLTCQFAENAATATSSVLVGSTFTVIEML